MQARIGLSVAVPASAMIAAMNVAIELERMGDYAKGIARINLMMGEQPLIKPLVDLPAIASEHPIPWLYNALQPADGCLLVVDLSAPDCVEQAVTLARA